ncbi:DUF2283 domain-containing protein [Streptomyces apocyni]|uniref:DUF2283 domain-containing protein n=1 Tax=Streptomyces apocyni TaxID=2654677 RepID=UPI0012EA7019|nr:DUF2283 domain-containing protein [Streptomyces apocyni]
MSEPMVRIEIEPSVDLAYVELSQGQVDRTDEFTPEIAIDLDRYGMVLGIELLTLSVNLDAELRARLAGQYHIPSSVLDLLSPALNVVADWERQVAERKAAQQLAPRATYGVLRASTQPRLTECH